MNATQPQALPQHLQVVLALAHVLERMERSHARVDAGQYRSVVHRLSAELEKLPADPLLDAILRAHPAASELYENLHYGHAGLCRSSLDFSLSAEMKAKEILAKASTH